MQDEKLREDLKISNSGVNDRRTKSKVFMED
jgi:hypothetical protein